MTETLLFRYLVCARARITPAAEISEDEEIVKIAARAVREVTGKDPEIGGIAGGTDARYLINKARIPTIYDLGPGRIDRCHVADEYIEIKPLIDAVKVFAKIVLDACGYT